MKLFNKQSFDRNPKNHIYTFLIYINFIWIYFFEISSDYTNPNNFTGIYYTLLVYFTSRWDVSFLWFVSITFFFVWIEAYFWCVCLPIFISDLYFMVYELWIYLTRNIAIIIGADIFQRKKQFSSSMFIYLFLYMRKCFIWWELVLFA